LMDQHQIWSLRQRQNMAKNTWNKHIILKFVNSWIVG
jgi:hypothetical protein